MAEGPVVLLADYYPSYLTAFAARERGALAPLGYEAHLARLVGDHFGSFASYRNHLRRAGVPAELLVGNYHELQQKWLDERPTMLRATPQTKFDVLFAQLEELRPWAVFCGSMFDYYESGFLRRVAEQITPNVFCWISCPYPDNLDFGPVRCVLSSVPRFVERFEAQGVRSALLDAAFDPDVLDAVGPVERELPLTFIGSLSSSTHSFRQRSLERLAEAEVGLEVWGPGLAPGLVGRLARKLRLPLPERLKSPLERCVRGEKWGLEMWRTLARSRVTLNFHIDVALGASYVGNMRMFEATGMGCALVTDWGPNLRRFFADDEVASYRDADELERRVRELVCEPELARQIGLRGQRACLDRHSYPSRIPELVRILERHASAPRRQAGA